MENIKLIVDGTETEYVRKDSLKQKVINIDASKSVATVCIGKKVIVRSRREGINCGVVAAADDTGIILDGCRRLWYHKPIDKSLSWYEGVANTGLSKDSKISCTAIRKIIIEDYSVTYCTDSAYKSIMESTTNAQD